MVVLGGVVVSHERGTPAGTHDYADGFSESLDFGPMCGHTMEKGKADT